MILMFSPLLSDSMLRVNLYFQLYFSIGNKNQQQCFQIEEKQAKCLCQCLVQIEIFVFSWTFISVATTLVISQWLLLNY